VICGLIMHSLGDRANNAESAIFHIEGDPGHPVNRGTFCPKGAALRLQMGNRSQGPQSCHVHRGGSSLHPFGSGGGPDGINHYIMEGSIGAVKAESCDDCGSYLKLLYLEKDRQMEAMVDDLATLALDILMDKERKTRGGPNLFFHPGRSL
jgi:hypothetical protein